MNSLRQRVALRALTAAPARSMSVFRASTPLMGGDGHPEHFLDIAYKAKNENYEPKQKGDNFFLQQLYENVYSRNPILGLYIICGAIIIEVISDDFFDNYWAEENIGTGFEGVTARYHGIPKDLIDDDEDEDDEDDDEEEGEEGEEGGDDDEEE